MWELIATIGTAATAWASWAELMCYYGIEPEYYCATAEALQAGPYQFAIG